MKLIQKLSFLFIFICLLSKISFAQETILLDSANKAYEQKNYKKAIQLYENLAGKFQAPEVYYNLGNAYYKIENIPLAILNYERAKKLKPNDDDIKLNLELANKKIIDRMPESVDLMSESMQSVNSTFSEKGWSVLTIVFALFFFIVLGLYISLKNITIRKVNFWSALFFAVLIVFTFTQSVYSVKNITDKDQAIITTSTVKALSGPTKNSTLLFILHEGTKVSIVRNEGGWSEIKLSDGKVGWVENSAFFII